MRHLGFTVVVSALFAALIHALVNETGQSQLILGNFSPPPVFENVNLVRSISLERSYVRENVNLVIKNVAKEAVRDYYLPFAGDTIGRVGGLEVRDKLNTDLPPFAVELVAYDASSSTQFYKVSLPKALDPDEQQTLALNFYTTSALKPLPAKIAQDEQQYLQYTFSAYFPSAYPTTKQKTKLRFPSDKVADYTELPSASFSKSGITSENAKDPVKSGSTFTYGPFSKVPAGALETIVVRYEFTNPLVHANLLERDVEVSHWGGNLATEERYWLVNRAAGLKNHFNRVQWQQQAYFQPSSVALKHILIALQPGSKDAYFIDEIGNVSTSKFAPGNGKTPAMLDLRPRFPIFGDWRYSFKIGWDRDLRGALRRLPGADSYILRVPFLEGPKEKEGFEYGKVVLRIVLPEGAENVRFSTLIALVANETSTHRTFMDTQGRTALVLTAVNLVDDLRMQDVVITYDYPRNAMLRKPLVIAVAAFATFLTLLAVGAADVRITAPRKFL